MMTYHVAGKREDMVIPHVYFWIRQVWQQCILPLVVQSAILPLVVQGAVPG
jgi:hypothetical protein